MSFLMDFLVKIYKELYLNIFDITSNYGLSLVLLSLFLYVILFPINRKAQQIQNKEREIQTVIMPQIAKIKDTYSGQEQYERIQRLYYRYSYHPIYSIRSAVGFVLQIPFLMAAYYMLSGLTEIKGVSWGGIPNLGEPDQLLAGINLLPFVMTFVTVLYAFVIPKLSKKEIVQTIIIGIIFLIVLYPAPSALLVFWTCNLLWSLLHCLLFDRLQWFDEYAETAGNFISGNELAFHIIFALALTIGLFVPLEVYIKNADQLWFGFKEVLKFFLATTAKYFMVLLLIYVICWRRNIRKIYLSVLAGLLLGVFLQAYIIELNYGLFDGHEINWNEYTGLGILNTFIWLYCLWIAFTKFKQIKSNAKIRNLIKSIAFSLVVLQCVVLLFTFKMNPLPLEAYQNRKSINILTTKDMFTISSKNNVIVILLDAFEAKIFEEMMSKEPQIIEELKGFTFYPDTTSVYGFTHNSVPQILTGKTYYNDMPHSQYLEEAWKGNEYYQKLDHNHYDVGIYTIQTITAGHAPIDNLISEDIELNENSMQDFTNLVRFRMMPHYLKQLFYLYDPNGKLSLLKNQKVQVYEVNDGDFYSELKKGLTYTDNNNCFRFYHLEGAHYPYIYNRNMEFGLYEKNNLNRYEQSVGVMKIVIEYIRQMKEKGIFDDSTFVIMADHGDFNQPGSRPLLCMKQPGSQMTDMKVSDDSISYSEFLPMLFQRFDENKKGNQRNFSLPVRKYYLQQERDFVEYEIIGNAKDLTSWKKKETLGSWYKNQGRVYSLGEEIDCTDKNPNFEMFQGTGWMEKSEPKGSWSVGAESTLQFNLSNYQKGTDLVFSFTADSYISNLPYRTAKFYVNDVYITDVLFDNKNYDFSFRIPADVINSNLLRIRFTIDHNGLSIKDWGTMNDLSILWKKIKIDAK